MVWNELSSRLIRLCNHSSQTCLNAETWDYTENNACLSHEHFCVIGKYALNNFNVNCISFNVMQDNCIKVYLLHNLHFIRKKLSFSFINKNIVLHIQCGKMRLKLWEYTSIPLLWLTFKCGRLCLAFEWIQVIFDFSNELSFFYTIWMSAMHSIYCWNDLFLFSYAKSFLMQLCMWILNSIYLINIWLK